MLDSIMKFFEGSAASRLDGRWNIFETEGEFKDILYSSNHKPQMIYKHSSRCSVSFMAVRNLHELSEKDWEKADFHMIDVIGQRSLSRFIAEKSGVRHEYPQVLIFKDGAVVWHGSHYRVNAESVQEYLS